MTMTATATASMPMSAIPETEAKASAPATMSATTTTTMPMTTSPLASSPMTFQEMRDIDIRSVDPDLLVDIKSVQINTSLSRDERVLDFLEQVKNPYCFKVGKAAVKVSFADTEATVEDCLERYLLSL